MNTAPQEVFFRDHGLVQDKELASRFLSASPKPQTAMITKEAKKHGSEIRRTAHLAGRTHTDTKAAAMQIAKRHGWTESFMVGVAVERLVENTIGLQLAATLAKALTEAVDRRLKPIDEHLARLSLEDLYEAREVKLYLLEWFRASMPPEEFHQLQERIHKKARTG